MVEVNRSELTSLNLHLKLPFHASVKRFGDFRTVKVENNNATELDFFVQEGDWEAFKQAIADAFIEDSMKDVEKTTETFGVKPSFAYNYDSEYEAGVEENRCCDGCCKSGSF